MSGGKICWSDGDGLERIRLRQVGRNNFSVEYGLQRKERLDYAAAAAELGECLMHRLACDSQLDNRHRGER